LVEIIAEVGNAHEGSLGLAHAHIDAAAKAGADTVKFQTHIAEAESTPSEAWRVKFSTQDGSRYDYWRRLEFTESQWGELKRHAENVGLGFLSSPFSVEAMMLLQRIGVDRWKVASGEVKHWSLLNRIAATKQPVLISTGLAYEAEIDTAVRKFYGNDLTLLHCVSKYPCPPEYAGINVMGLMQFAYGESNKVGLSDHSGTIFPGLIAAYQGAAVIEVHLTLSREMFGPDVIASLTSTELRQLVDGVRFIERMTPCEKIVDQEMRAIFMTRDEQGRKISAA
jgi:N,N'-diacetyllegionaminate synthase